MKDERFKKRWISDEIRIYEHERCLKGWINDKLRIYEGWKMLKRMDKWWIKNIWRIG